MANAQSLPRLSTASPAGFFTNVAARLLWSELHLDLNHIQVYPTNQYTPAVHRLLQVAANLYDCTTNRTFNGAAAPYCPTVFRPLYRRVTVGTNTLVFINGFREVVGTTIITPELGSPELELDTDPGSIVAIPPLGTPPGPERAEPLISGLPLVVAARTGFPNFNEFAMQTYIGVSRMLEFRRDVFPGPVTHTNQMYVAAITNAFGLEAWNAYTNSYPRPLEMRLNATMTAIVSNELGTLLVSNRVAQTNPPLDIPANAWAGWTNSAAVGASFLLPWGTNANFMFLTNATYNALLQQFVPFTHVFTGATMDMYFTPHWWLNLNTRLRYILIDTAANRVVDYVDLNYWQPTIDLSEVLAPPTTDCSGNPASLGDQGVLFCTNRIAGSTSLAAPTIGVINQIALNLFLNPNIWLTDFSLDPYSGTDAETAIDGFRYNLMGWGPVFPKDIGRIFYRSNVFYAPLVPFRPIFIHTSWQANDPLVHYTTGDLLDLSAQQVDYLSHRPPLDSVGRPNYRYQPWGGNPFGTFSRPPIPDYEPAAKDPGITRPDLWNFPSGQSLGPSWLGQVHRGTPWQTLFLKSATLGSLSAWQVWTGDNLVRPDWLTGVPVADALSTMPTNDWHLISLLAPWFNTNPPTSLAAANQPNAAAWAALLDGMTALTNVAAGQFDPIVLSSNSPQAEVMAAALDGVRNSEPGGLFQGMGEFLATPELSIASPCLNNTIPASYYISEQAFEAIPSQLLSLLRPDSFGSLAQSGGLTQVQFTGFDAYTYLIQASPDLLNWSVVSTNSPTNGVFNFVEPASTVPQGRYYRSELLP